jgi:hypothetical protein
MILLGLAWNSSYVLRSFYGSLMRLRIFQGAAFLLLLGAVAGFVWVVVEGVRADPALVGALATTGITVVSGITVAGWQARVQRREAAERLQRETITPYYDKLIRMVSSRALIADDGDPSEDAVGEMGEIQHHMLMWSGSGTINAWTEAMRVTEAEPSGTELMLAYSRVLRAIRAELGHDDSKLDARNLLRIFINDIDDHIPPGVT